MPDSRATPQRRGVSLNQYALHKEFTVEFLKSIGARNTKYLGRPAVAFDYHDAQGNVFATRYRISLDGPDKFRWKKVPSRDCTGWTTLLKHAKKAAQPPRLSKVSSDVQTSWYKGITAVGVPGASMWREDRDAVALDHFKTIYVVVEPDAGGETLLNRLLDSRIADRIWVVRLWSVQGRQAKCS